MRYGRVFLHWFNDHSEMNKKKIIVLIRLFISLTACSVMLLPYDMRAQVPVPVEITSQKIVSDGRVYYMHQVRKGQTLYSISKAYNVTVSQLTEENNISDNSIREGQVLRIPAVTVAEAQKPAVTTPASQDERYIYHRVRRGETLASIASEYGISVRDLKKANRRLLFPHEGDNLLIPRRKISQQYEEKKALPVADTVKAMNTEGDTTVKVQAPETFTVNAERTTLGELNGSVRVAVMLPFQLAENSVRSYIDSSKRDAKGKKIYRDVTMSGSWIYEGSLPFLEMYEGILIAADSLRRLGLRIELDLYDTGSDTSRVDRLLLSGALNEADLIIGPVFSYNLSRVSAFAAQHDIPVVSPVQIRDQRILENRPTLYRVYPAAKVSQDVIISEVRTHPGSNIIFLYSDTLMSDPLTSEFWSRLKNSLAADNSGDTSMISSRYFTGLVSRRNSYSGVSSVESLLKPDRENLIILASTQTPVVSSAFSTLHTLIRKYDIKVMGYPEIRGLETVDLRYYYDLELFIPSESYIDFSKPASLAFSTAFMKKFRTEPMAESFAWRGFDIAWYFIGGIASHGNAFLKDPGIFNPELLCLEPDFRREDRNNGYENRGMFILHYKKDMTIEVRRPVSASNAMPAYHFGY